ncbi:MAG: methyltransferase domain-containing protein [Ferruginibacter sp.]
MSIAKYYQINKIPYSLFHSRDDLIYMGISRDGTYKDEDLLEHAKLVEKYIQQIQAKEVLELATGRGASSSYLAKRHSDVKFAGVDLPKGHISYAVKKAKQLPNYHPVAGDYHDLSRFPDDTFDIVFVIEALCYSTRKNIVLNEVKRVLRKGGIFIVFDGYSEKEEKLLSAEEATAKELTAKGMVVEHFDYYTDFTSLLKKAGFTIIQEEDVSKYIMPTLYKFERTAQRFFSLPQFLAQMLVKILPPEFTHNAISAYLMPTLVKNGVFGYQITVGKEE